MRSDDASHDNDEDDDGGGGGEDAMVTRLVVLRATDWRVEELLVLATYPFLKQIAGAGSTSSTLKREPSFGRILDFFHQPANCWNTFLYFGKYL